MKIVGILNVTPDSFSDGGKYIDINKAVNHAMQMIKDGADIIDVGGESTRPGAIPVSLEEELERVIPVIKRLSQTTNVSISIDTYKAEVARQAILAGASIINDIGGAKFDSEMPRVMAESGAQIILMHNRPPETFGIFDDLISEVVDELKSSIALVLEAGVKPEKIILDPGTGFGKTIPQNIELLKKIQVLKKLGFPILLGTSKKGTLRELMENNDKSLLGIGTVATTCYAYTQGVDYIRVHDVRDNRCAIQAMKNLNA